MFARSVCVRPCTELEFRAPEPERDDPRKHSDGKPERPRTPGASGKGPIARTLLLLGVSAIAAAAASEALAQDAQLPPLTVEGAKPAAKKKAAAKKAPSAAPAAVASAPVAAPTTAKAVVTEPSDVPYTVPAGVSVVGSGEIGTFGQSNIDNVIRTMPGTYTRESPNQPGVAVNIRGFEGSGRVNMMIDGVRQNFRFVGHEARGFVYVDPQLLAGIDIDRGAVTTRGGAGALAGTANFRTLDVEDIIKPGQSTGVLTSATYGTNGAGWSEMFATGARTNSFGIAGAISKRDQENYRNGDDIRVPFTDQDLLSGLFKTYLKPTEDSKISFGGVFYGNDFTANSYFQNIKAQTLTAAYVFKPRDNSLIDFKVPPLSPRQSPAAGFACSARRLRRILARSPPRNPSTATDALQSRGRLRRQLSLLSRVNARDPYAWT